MARISRDELMERPEEILSGLEEPVFVGVGERSSGQRCPKCKVLVSLAEAACYRGWCEDCFSGIASAGERKAPKTARVWWGD